jgi:Flp pilus assembly protein TadG
MKFARRLSTFANARQGNVMMLSAFVLPAILALAGMAVDLQFTFRQKEKVQYALDSAVLAGALSRQAGATEAAVIADVNAYLGALIADQGGGLDCTAVTVSFSAANRDIDGAMRCIQPTFISSLIGMDQLEFPVDSTSTYGVGKIDVAFVFDVSGSMNDNGRLAALKSAAHTAFDELLPDDRPRDGTVRIGIATYNHAVNAGSVFNTVTRSVTLNADSSNSAAKTRYSANIDARMTDQATGKRFFYYERGTCSSSRGCNENSSYTWNVRRRFFNDVLPNNTCAYERIGVHAASDAAPGSGAWIGAGNPRWNFSASSSNKYYGWQEVDNGGADAYGYGAFEARLR